MHITYTLIWQTHTKGQTTHDTVLSECRFCIVKSHLRLLQTFAPTVRSSIPPKTLYTGTIHQEQ